MQSVTVLAFALVFMGVYGVGLAADANAGKLKAQNCAACHGVDGISVVEAFPSLAGQKKIYLIKQLKDFRVGLRKDTQMTYWAQKLTDADIGDLAEFYSQQKCVPANPKLP